MKRCMLLVAFIAFNCFISKADTIDFWHVYYNDSLIQKFNIHNDSEVIVIKVKMVQSVDSIRINYFRDAPCTDCHLNLMVRTDKNNKIIYSKAVGTGSTLSFDLRRLVNVYTADKKRYFEVLYDDDYPGNKKIKLLFLLKFE